MDTISCKSFNCNSLLSFRFCFNFSNLLKNNFSGKSLLEHELIESLPIHIIL